MLKVIAIAVLIYLVYRWVKPKPAQTEKQPDSGGQLEDEMIRDPQCEAYFPKSTAVEARIDGKMVYFCSNECRDKYLERYKAK